MPLWIVFALAPLLCQLVLLSVLGAAVNRAAFGLFGKTVYLLLMWPGVTVHELSHLAGCLLTGTRVRRVALFSPREEGGGMTLGFVEHDRPRNPLFRTIVAGAPFFGGSAVILGVTRAFLPAFARAGFAPIAVVGADAGSLFSAMARAFEGYAAAAVAAGASLHWSSWQAWLLLYILFSVAAHVSPSRQDLVHAAGGAVFLAVSLFAFEWIAAARWSSAAQAVAGWTSSAAGVLTMLLGYGLAVLIVAWAALWIVAAVKGALRRSI